VFAIGKSAILRYLTLLLLGGALTLSLAPIFAQTPPGDAPAGQTTEQTANDTPDELEEAAAGQESLWAVIVKGGWVMIPLALVSTLIIAFSLERFFFFKRKNLDVKGAYDATVAALREGGVAAVQKTFAEDPRLIGQILSAGLGFRDKGADRVDREIANAAQAETGTLERGLNLLSNLGNMAPLLGFLGTVTGMRNSFLQFVVQVAPTAQDLAAGVEEALITTVAGLIVAIPTYLVYNLFIYRIDSFTNEVERCTQAILSRMD
jgi:biopolymer transport protein ExbB